MKNPETDIFDLISKHLPPPPAAILAAGDGAAGTLLDDLRQLGYQVTRRNTSTARTDPSGDREHGDSGEDSGKLTQYDAVLFCGSFNAFDPLRSTFETGQDLLEPKGIVLMCRGRDDDSSRGQNPAARHPRDLFTVLYESGFVIRVNEKITAEDRKRHDPEKQVERGYHLVFAKKDGVFIRGYQDGDETAILEMFREVFKADRKIEHWYWKFRDNPFGAYRIAVASDRDGTLAGHYSGYPVAFHTSLKGGEVFLSYQIGDIMTRPGFRQIGLAGTSVLARITDYFHHRFCLDTVPFMYGFVTGNHKRFGERFLRYRYMSEIPYYVLDATGSRLSVKGTMPLFLSGFSVKKVTEITPEFDAFFQDVSKGYGLLVKRDASYLKWRYMDCPDKLHTLFAVRRFGKLVGWSVFSKRGEMLIWGDALFRKTTDARTIKRMLAHVRRYYFPGLTRIEGWFSPVPRWWTKLLRDIGFRATNEPNKLVSGVTIFDRSFSLGYIEQNLYYTMGDSDLF